MFRLSMLVLIFILTGCATTQFGNFVAHNDEAHNKRIASDVTGQLIQLYPPASTQFNMQHPTVDSLGDALVDNLRAGGYPSMNIKNQTLTSQRIHLHRMV